MQTVQPEHISYGINKNMKDLANQISDTVGLPMDIRGIDPSQLNTNIVNNGTILTQDEQEQEQELLSEEEEEDDDDDSDGRGKEPSKPGDATFGSNGKDIG